MATVILKRPYEGKDAGESIEVEASVAEALIAAGRATLISVPPVVAVDDELDEEPEEE